MIYERPGVLVAALAFLVATAGLASSNPINDPELETDLEEADYINDLMSSMNPEQKQAFKTNYLYPFMIQRAEEEAERGEVAAPDYEDSGRQMSSASAPAPPPPPVAAGGGPTAPLNAREKRRRRYGFWITAINKMDNGHLRGFLGKHKNVYTVYKRNGRPGRGIALPRMH